MGEVTAATTFSGLPRLGIEITVTCQKCRRVAVISGREPRLALLLYDHTGKRSIDELLTLFDYGRARYGCDQFIIDSLMRLGVAGDDYNTQEAVVFRVVEWCMASKVHVHLVAHSKKGERDRGAPVTEDIKGAMEIGANAFNIVSVWRDRKHEDSVALLRQSDPEGAAKLFNEKPGVILNVAKQRNGDFEGKTGLWFNQKTYRYRSRADSASWKRSYLPDGWQQQYGGAE